MIFSYTIQNCDSIGKRFVKKFIAHVCSTCVRKSKKKGLKFKPINFRFLQASHIKIAYIQSESYRLGQYIKSFQITMQISGNSTGAFILQKYETSIFEQKYLDKIDFDSKMLMLISKSKKKDNSARIAITLRCEKGKTAGVSSAILLS